MKDLMFAFKANIKNRFRLPSALIVAPLHLAIAVVYAIIWPGEEGSQDYGLHRLVLRWAHPAVWLLLGITSLLYGVSAPTGAVKRVAFAALGLYAAFILARIRA